MIKVMCVQKHKDKQGKIIGYTLKDQNGQLANFYADALKDHIRNQRIDVVNLTLTSDNRLVETAVKELKTKQVEKAKPIDQKVKPIDQKARKLGKNQYKCIKIYKDLDNNTMGYRCLSSEDKLTDFTVKSIDKKVKILGIETAPTYDLKSKNIRDEEIAKMSRKAKIDYYDDTLWSTRTFDTLEFNIDELECELEWNIKLEVGDHGSSGFDIIYERNPARFPNIDNIRYVCKLRGLLTYEEFDKYILGCDDKGRICNRYTFADWVIMHKK